jgi:isopenicillin N synthase-like dioxygenase
MGHFADSLFLNGYIAVSPDLPMRKALHDTFSCAFEFYQQGPAHKAPYAMPDRREGYRAMGSEYSATEDRPDLAETFSCSTCNGDVIGSFPPGHGRRLYQQMLDVTLHFASLAESIANDIREALCSLPPRHFEIEGWSRLQMNCTHPAAAEREILHDRHEDGDLFTLTYVTHEGMEIETDDGEWRPLWNPGQLLVLPGETLCLISGGRIPPRYHRVLRSNASMRLALLYFVDLAPHSSEAWIANELNRDIDIGSRLFDNSARYGVPPVRDRVPAREGQA